MISKYHLTTITPIKKKSSWINNVVVAMLEDASRVDEEPTPPFTGDTSNHTQQLPHREEVTTATASSRSLADEQSHLGKAHCSNNAGDGPGLGSDTHVGGVSP